ncbi:hypothetical protein CEXT_527291 [Caerostris extrusa]|uniref:Uncharacterized protein n=1 Tax=Caerostris extrusa TaxID=172846 RepID=A0AAV4N521_CAEEX|nr:hypothetical protein CEXT_527291 [Caerostris extrusa]
MNPFVFYTLLPLKGTEGNSIHSSLAKTNPPIGTPLMTDTQMGLCVSLSFGGKRFGGSPADDNGATRTIIAPPSNYSQLTPAL